MAKRRTKGEGSIYYDEKNDRWLAQITLPNGKRRTKSGQTKKQVTDWLLKQRTKASEGTWVADDKITFGEFLSRYMATVAEHSLRPTTLRGHYSLIENHIDPGLGRIRLTNLGPHHIQSFYAKKLDEGLSRRTVQYAHSIIRKSLQQAFKWGLVVRNPADLVDSPTPKKKKLDIWTPEQLNTFLQAVENHMWYPIYVVAAYTGMRQGEILGIHKEDVDLDNGIIHVNHAIQYIIGEGLVVTRPKTESSRRPITIPDTALKVLEKHLKTVESGLIFTTSSGKAISARNIVRHFKRVIEETRLPEIRFHDLRHTHASLLLKAGVNPKVVQERLGHSQISLTLDTYSHVVPSLQEEAALKFEDMMG